MRHKNVQKAIIVFLLFLIIVLVLSIVLSGCGTREEKTAYLRRFELVQRDECGPIVVYVLRDSKTDRQYAVFRAGNGMDVLEVTP